MLKVIAAIVAITLSFAAGRYIERPDVVDNDKEVHRLAQNLTWWIIVNTDYDYYIEPPNIRFVPQAELNSSGELGRKGWTIGGTQSPGLIRLQDSQKIDSVILLHELVHHLQEKFKPHMSACEREIEAHTFDQKYAASIGRRSPTPPGIMEYYRRQCR